MDRYHAPPSNFDAYRMLGRGTVNTQEAEKLLSSVLRPLGLPNQEEMINRFHRY